MKTNNNFHSLKKTFDAGKVTKKYPYGEQQKVVLQAFLGSAKTMLEVERLTGLKRTSICGYVGLFRKKGIITAVYKAPCKISKYKAIHWQIK